MSIINLGAQKNPFEDLPGYWQKVAALVVHKLAGREPVEISAADFSSINAQYRGGACLCTEMVDDKLVLQLADAAVVQQVIADTDPNRAMQ